MNKILLTIAVGIIFCSYTSCTTMNRKDIDSVGKELLKYVILDDSAKIGEFLSDSAYFKSEDIEYYLNTYKNSDYQILRVDTSSVNENKYLEVYYKIDTFYHVLECHYDREENDNIGILGLHANNMTKDYWEYVKEPYNPRLGVNFPQYTWAWEGSYLTRFSVFIRNVDVALDIDELKFKLILYVDNEPIINRTFVCKEKIYSGDVIEYQIRELKGHFIPKPLTKNNVTCSIEPIEAKPKPKFYYADILESLSKNDNKKN